MREQSAAGLEAKLAQHGLHADRQVYLDRLAFELDVILRMNFAGYFLIVSDFMKWTRGQAFPSACAARAPPRWSPGRSISPISTPSASASCSSASSIPSASRCRISISISARSGATKSCAMCARNTAAIASPISWRWGSLQARAAVRDAGRVLQMPLGLVDRIAKLVPNPPGKPVSMEDAFASEPRLQQIAEQEPTAQKLFSIVEKIEGLYRPRLHPSRRRRDRRPAAGRDRAALPRSALRNAGDAVRL